jgi:DNA-binding LacI/PurR family transcriptional regulator
VTLDGTSGAPLYQQLRQVLFSRIRGGEFAAGAMLPSENQLREEYGVSVTTARRALLELVKEGVVRRRVGVGTMVAPQVRQARIAVVTIANIDHAWRRVSAGMGELIVGVGELTWSRDASLSISGVDEERSDAYLRSLVEARSVDGVLLRTVSDIQEAHLDILEGAGMPYVVIRRERSGRPMNCVVSDDVRGARMAAEHLIQAGHRRVGFVCANPALKLTRDRLAGYREALANASIEFDEGLVRLEPSFAETMGQRAVDKLLALPSRPTAVLVASDTMAVGAYRAAHAVGLAVPDDVAFVGYDDIGPAAAMEPPLTTVRTSYYDFGRLATQLLLDLIDRRLEPPQRLVIEPQLVVRQSAGRPRAKPRRPAPAASRAPGRRVAVGGADVLGAALAGAGFEVVPEDAAEIDASVRALDLRRGLERELAIAAAAVERGARSVVLVGLCPAAEGPARAAAVAALNHVTRELAGNWSARGVRVNGVVASNPDLSDAVASCLLLLSEEATTTGIIL